MRLLKRQHLLLLLISIVCDVAVIAGESFEPYKVLGVHRRATAQEIRKSYKKLAKEWHPDKVQVMWWQYHIMVILFIFSFFKQALLNQSRCRD